MLDEKGEKWACEACIKGHRVSNCQHKDRKLQHINKKGRPVSQCQHCRRLRKSHSAHVRCECGEQNHANHSKQAKQQADDDHTCACAQGGKCTCSIKKEPNESYDIPKIPSTFHQRSHSKPNITTRRSEGSVPKLRHPHHSIHRQNNAAHEYGLPYPIPRSTSNPTAASLAQRSCESLPGTVLTEIAVPSQPKLPEFAFSLPQDDRNTSFSHLHSRYDAAMPYEALVRPAMPSLNVAFMNNAISPANPMRYSMNDFSQFNYGDFSTSQYDEQTLLSANVEQSGFNWTEWDLEDSSDYNSFTSQCQQTSSVASAEHSGNGHPGLSRSSSGTASERGDYVSRNPEYGFQNTMSLPSVVSTLWTGPMNGSGRPNGLMLSEPYQERMPDLSLVPEDGSVRQQNSNEFRGTSAVVGQIEDKDLDYQGDADLFARDALGQCGSLNSLLGPTLLDDETAIWDADFSGNGWL